MCSDLFLFICTYFEPAGPVVLVSKKKVCTCSAAQRGPSYVQCEADEEESLKNVCYQECLFDVPNAL